MNLDFDHDIVYSSVNIDVCDIKGSRHNTKPRCFLMWKKPYNVKKTPTWALGAHCESNFDLELFCSSNINVY